MMFMFLFKTAEPFLNGLRNYVQISKKQSIAVNKLITVRVTKTKQHSSTYTTRTSRGYINKKHRLFA